MPLHKGNIWKNAVLPLHSYSDLIVVYISHFHLDIVILIRGIKGSIKMQEIFTDLLDQAYSPQFLLITHPSYF